VRRRSAASYLDLPADGVPQIAFFRTRLFSVLPKRTKLTTTLILFAFFGQLLVSSSVWALGWSVSTVKAAALRWMTSSRSTSDRPPHAVRASSRVAGNEVTLLRKALSKRPLLDRNAGALIPGQLLDCRERCFRIEEQVIGVEPADPFPLKGHHSSRCWSPVPTIAIRQPQRSGSPGASPSPALVTWDDRR
jgi:hypothetical protein